MAKASSHNPRRARKPRALKRNTPTLEAVMAEFDTISESAKGVPNWACEPFTVTEARVRTAILDELVSQIVDTRESMILERISARCELITIAQQSEIHPSDIALALHEVEVGLTYDAEVRNKYKYACKLAEIEGREVPAGGPYGDEDDD